MKFTIINFSDLSYWGILSAEFHAGVDKDIKEKVMSMTDVEIQNELDRVSDSDYKYYFDKFVEIHVSFYQARGLRNSNKKVFYAMLLQGLKNANTTIDKMKELIDSHRKIKEMLGEIYIR